MKTSEENVDLRSDYYINNPSEIIRAAFLYPVQLGHYYYLPGYSICRNSFDSFLLMVILDGSCLVQYGSDTRLASKNSFVLLNCYEKHGYSSEKGWESVWIHFDGTQAKTMYDMIRSHLGNVFTLSESAPVIECLLGLLEPYRKGLPVSELQVHRQLTDLLTDLSLYSPLHYPSGRAAAPRDASLRADGEDSPETAGYLSSHHQEAQHLEEVEMVQAFIKQNIREELRIEELAKQAMMSPYYFIRVFKKYTGMAPHEYIVNYRIALAKYLLVQTLMSVRDISYEVGFSSESVFCSSFKKHTGVSPTAYRKARRIP